MINCGATEDVRGICGFQDNDSVRVIIIDSHRPVWHGYNDSVSDTIVVVDKDDPVPASEIPVAEEGDHFLRDGGKGLGMGLLQEL